MWTQIFWAESEKTLERNRKGIWLAGGGWESILLAIGGTGSLSKAFEDKEVVRIFEEWGKDILRGEAEIGRREKC